MPAIFRLEAIGIATAKSQRNTNIVGLVACCSAGLALLIEWTEPQGIAGHETSRSSIITYFVCVRGWFLIRADAHVITKPTDRLAPFRAAGNAIITTLQTSLFQATCDVSHTTVDRNAAEGKDKNER